MAEVGRTGGYADTSVQGKFEDIPADGYQCICENGHQINPERAIQALMLGYEPQMFHSDTEPAPIPAPAPEDVEEELSAHQYQIFAALRDEN